MSKRARQNQFLFNVGHGLFVSGFIDRQTVSLCIYKILMSAHQLCLPFHLPPRVRWLCTSAVGPVLCPISYNSVACPEQCDESVSYKLSQQIRVAAVCDKRVMLSVSLSLFLFLFLSVCLCLSVSLSICLSVSVFVSLSLSLSPVSYTHLTLPTRPGV